jgi:hypothetical protein
VLAVVLDQLGQDLEHPGAGLQSLGLATAQYAHPGLKILPFSDEPLHHPQQRLHHTHNALIKNNATYLLNPPHHSPHLLLMPFQQRLDSLNGKLRLRLIIPRLRINNNLLQPRNMHFQLIDRPIIDIMVALPEYYVVDRPVLLFGEVAVVFLDGVDEQVVVVFGELENEVGLHPVVEGAFYH